MRPVHARQYNSRESHAAPIKLSANDQHPNQRLRINRGPAGLAMRVEIDMSADDSLVPDRQSHEFAR
jgi:hypothetical protein